MHHGFLPCSSLCHDDASCDGVGDASLLLLAWHFLPLVDHCQFGLLRDDAFDRLVEEDVAATC